MEDLANKTIPLRANFGFNYQMFQIDDPSFTSFSDCCSKYILAFDCDFIGQIFCSVGNFPCCVVIEVCDPNEANLKYFHFRKINLFTIVK